MALTSVLSPILGAVGTGLLQRTYLLQTNTGNGIPIILAVFDAVLEESPEFSATVTQHPVEAGKEVTDHIQIKNTTLRLKGTISNSPVDLSTSIGNLLAGGVAVATSAQARSNILNTGLQQAAGLGAAALIGNASGGGALSGAADAISRSVLLNAFEQRNPFDVITKRQRYESMVIERLGFPRDQSTGYQLVFEMDLIQIRIVSPNQVDLSTVGEDVITTALAPSDLGSQVTKEPSLFASLSGGKSILRGLVK